MKETKLEVGRDLDRLVSEKLGHPADWHYKDRPPYCDCKELMYSTGPDIRDYETVPEYSTSWDAAMQIAEFVWKKNLNFKLTLANYAGWYDVEISGDRKMLGWERHSEGPLTICLAFLQLPDEVLQNANE